ncbi:MAG: hypothetical protein KDA56_16690 [Hyphomonas sp.]|nr:hypothetical protein [Hyphomonas sp.]
MINRLLLLFGAMAAFGLPQASLADKYPDGYAAARQEMNVLGDDAFAGDRAALRSLEAAADKCVESLACPDGSADVSRAAAAFTNLGWLYWTKEAFGQGEKTKGMTYFAKAAALGSPQGLYQVAECMHEDCLPLNMQAAVFGDLLATDKDITFFGGVYNRLMAISGLFGEAAHRGLVAAAVAKTRVDNQLLSLSRSTQEDWDDDMLAIFSHLNGIIDASLSGLAANPSEDERGDLEYALEQARAQASQFETEVAAARARRQGATAISRIPPLEQASPPGGEKYAADRSRALGCIEESERVRQWRRQLDDWARDLSGQEDELDQERINLELSDANTADYNLHNARIDAFNEEGREYDAEQRRYNAAAAAYHDHCDGSFSGAAIDEVCAGSAADSKFCRSFH